MNIQTNFLFPTSAHIELTMPILAGHFAGQCCHMVVRKAEPFMFQTSSRLKLTRPLLAGHFAGQCCQLVILQQFAPWQATLTTWSSEVSAN